MKEFFVGGDRVRFSNGFLNWAKEKTASGESGYDLLTEDVRATIVIDPGYREENAIKRMFVHFDGSNGPGVPVEQEVLHNHFVLVKA